MFTDAANNCKHVGYDEFEPASWPGSCAPSKSDWVLTENRILCGTNGAYPEEFWQCSDIRLTSGEGLSRDVSFKRRDGDFGVHESNSNGKTAWDTLTSHNERAFHMNMHIE